MLSASELHSAFPEVNPGVKPLGARVLVQIRTVRRKTESGLILSDDTRAFNKSVTQLAKVVSLGQLAYCNRSTGEKWPEGVWVKPGDFVRIPRYGGDRFDRPLPEDRDETVTFAIFQDHEILSLVEPEAFTSMDEIR